MKRHGYTLTELLIVLAIIGLLGLIFIPSFFRFYVNASDPLKLTARELSQILQTARMYAMTYRVNTAVVYQDVEISLSLTNVEAENRGIIVGTQPSLNVLKSAAVMYEISSTNNPNFEAIRDRLSVPPTWDSFYVPTESVYEFGISKEFGTGIVLCNVEYKTDAFAPNLSIPLPQPVFYRDANNRRVPNSGAFRTIGLQLVKVPFLDVAGMSIALDMYEEADTTGRHRYVWPAHIFDYTGKLKSGSGNIIRERYRVSLLDTANTVSTVFETELGGDRNIPPEKLWVYHRVAVIEIYRASGRIRTLL